MGKYREIQGHNYYLNCKELLFNQVSLYMKYLSDENPKMELLKKQTMKFGEQMEFKAALVNELEQEIYGASQFVVKQLNKDNPHDYSKEYVDEVQICDKPKKLKPQQEAEEAPPSDPVTPVPKKGAGSKKEKAKEEKLQKKLEKLKV